MVKWSHFQTFVHPSLRLTKWSNTTLVWSRYGTYVTQHHAVAARTIAKHICKPFINGNLLQIWQYIHQVKAKAQRRVSLSSQIWTGSWPGPPDADGQTPKVFGFVLENLSIGAQAIDRATSLITGLSQSLCAHRENSTLIMEWTIGLGIWPLVLNQVGYLGPGSWLTAVSSHYGLLAVWFIFGPHDNGVTESRAILISCISLSIELSWHKYGNL